MKIEKEITIVGYNFEDLNDGFQKIKKAINKAPEKRDNGRFLYITVETTDKIEHRVTWNGCLRDDEDDLKKTIDSANSIIESVTEETFYRFYFSAKLKNEKY